jgi:hypothetical protein
LNKRASSALGKKLSIYEIVAKKIKNEKIEGKNIFCSFS